MHIGCRSQTGTAMPLEGHICPTLCRSPIEVRAARRYVAVALVVSVLSFAQELYSQGNDVALSASSPNGEYSIEAAGQLHSRGNLTLASPGRTTVPLFSEYFRYPPRITWLSASLARIWIGTGSQDFYIRYVSADPIKMSSQFYLAVAETPDLSRVVTVDFDKVRLFSIWSGELVRTYEAKGLHPLGFVGIDEGSVKFNGKNGFIISWSTADRHEVSYSFTLP